MNNTTNIAISIVILIAIVSLSFVYLDSNPPLIATLNPPWFGISAAQVTPELAEEIGLRDPYGVLVVTVVSGSPADKAGIRGGDKPAQINGKNILLGGDVIVGIDGMEVREGGDIFNYIQGERQIGDTVRVTIIRNGNVQELSVTLEERPSAAP